MQVAGSIALAVSLIAMSHAGAQSTDHQSHHVAQSSAAAAASDLVEGEVRKVDKEAGKITLKHAELKSLDMPPMTMVFQVQDKALLDKVKTGDKVRFAAAKIGGQLTVTAIEPGR
jgi:Cu(I)/Ag(I) efflux system protein CusF